MTVSFVIFNVHILYTVGETGNLTATTYYNFGFDQSIIYCPYNAYCNIIGHGSHSLDETEIISHDGTILNVVASGGDALFGAIIHCPSDIVYRGNNNDCNIHIIGDGHETNMINYLSIYAIESFNDFNLICDDNGYHCFDDLYNVRPKIYCTLDYSENCEINATLSIDNRWQCTNNHNTSNICNDYLIPTRNPTISPSYDTKKRLYVFKKITHKNI